MVDEPGLVTLFYRADWTRLALSAEVRELRHWRLQTQLSQPAHPKFTWVNVNTDLPPGYGDPVEHRARLRIAPGGRYLIGILTAWDVENPPEDGSVLRTRYGTRPGLPPPYPEVLWPSRLLNAFSLELAERVRVDGRTALRVIATPAPGVWQADEYKRPERIEVTADAETGILLRFEKFLDGQTVELTELTDVTFDPAGEFQVPDDADDDGQDAKSESQFFPGPRWEAAKTATNVFGTVLGTVARHVPRPPRDAAAWEQATADDDPEAAMPPAAGRFDSTVSGSLASDELLHTLYRSGRAEFSATLHLWLDGAAWGEWTQARAGDRGWGGIGSAAGVIGGRVGSTHTETRVTIGSAGQYRLDYLRGRQKYKPRAVACDGSRRWLEYDDRVIVGPVLPLPQEITKMVDTAPLLESHVSGVAETQVSGRRGFALRAATDGPDPRGLPWPLKESDLIVDAELGIVLRQICYVGDAQGLRYEFRDVAPPSADGGEFIFDVPQGVRVEHTDDWVLDELGVPAGMQSAIRSVESAAKAAQGFLNSLRGQ
jgi:outer membrane lipoprotein-sorting protein